MKKIELLNLKVIKILEELGCTIEKVEVNEITKEEMKLTGLTGSWIDIAGGNGFTATVEIDGLVNIFNEYGDFVKSYKNMKSAFKNFYA